MRSFKPRHFVRHPARRAVARVVSSRLVSSRLVSSRLVSSRLVSSRLGPESPNRRLDDRRDAETPRARKFAHPSQPRSTASSSRDTIDTGVGVTASATFFTVARYQSTPRARGDSDAAPRRRDAPRRRARCGTRRREFFSNESPPGRPRARRKRGRGETRRAATRRRREFARRARGGR